MSDPERGWTKRDIELEGRTVPSDTEVWIHRRGAAWTEIEFKGRRGPAPTDAIGDRPVPKPALEQLRQLDACFGLPDDAFEQTYIDRHNYFEIVKCNAHGRRFLRDVVGGWAMMNRLTLLSDDDDADNPQQVWRTYHDQTDAWHARRGRSY